MPFAKCVKIIERIGSESEFCTYFYFFVEINKGQVARVEKRV
jgi:hypothetical protein